MEALVTFVLMSVLGQTFSYTCPRSNARGLYPDPNDCSKYYQCVDGGRYYHKSCPPGLWFDSRYSICNWPGYVSCYSRRPEIQPLASEESDPVLRGTLRRYPQQLGRQVYTTQRRPTFRTLPTTRMIRKRTTRPARVFRTSKLTTLWPPRNTNVKTRTPRSPQTEKPTTRQQLSTTEDRSPGPVTTPQSVLDWLYEDMEEPQTDNAHPQAPPKDTPQANPINSVASMDEYGGFEETEDYQHMGYDTAFDPPPECSAAFSLELDPTRCEGFYQCYLWIPYPKVCPAGLLFDHQSNVCNWPEYVYCLNGERYDPPETTTAAQVATRAPVTPAAPSNNFNPQENGGFFEDNNYDDYWPIEEVMEGKRHQTAFKKKGLQAVSFQTVDEETEKKSTPRVKASTLMMNTDAINDERNKCGRGGCDAENVKTSDYKSQPKTIKSSPKAKDAKEKETTTTVTSTDKTDSKSSHVRVKPTSSSQEKSSSQSESASNETESNESSQEKSSSQSESASNEIESNESSIGSFEDINGALEAQSSEEVSRTKVKESKSSSQESSQNKGSSSQSSFASNETESSESNSSSEEQEGEIEDQSLEENNEIIKPELTSNNLKIKENEIQVDIVEIKESDDNKLQQQDSTAKNKSRTDALKPSTEASVSPATEKARHEENNSNNTRPEMADKTSTETPLQEESDSNDDTEGSGSEAVLSKIDTLRNAVEKFMSDDKQATSAVTRGKTKDNITDSKLHTNGTGDDPIFNTTNDAGNTTSPQQPLTTMLSATMSTETSTEFSVKTTTPLVVPEKTDENVTESNVTIIEEKLHSNLTDTNVTGAAEGKSDKSLDLDKQNTTGLDSTDLKNQTQNSTAEADLPEGEGISANETLGNDTNTALNVTTEEPLVKGEFNTTANITQAETIDSNTTQNQVSTNSKPSSSATTGPKDLSTTPKTKSGPEISKASSKTVDKAKATHPDIVMLSGKSPIARILEKLLNIRMKQIGNNKFKALETTKETLKNTEVLSENKIKPKSQNDQGRTTLSPKATTSGEASKTTPDVSSDSGATDASTFSTEVSSELTTVISMTEANITAQTTNSSDNDTSTGLSVDIDPANVSISIQNTTENELIAINETTHTTITVNTTAENSNATIDIMESTTVVFAKFTNDTSTSVENSTILTTSSNDVLATAAAGQNSNKESAKEALNIPAREAERTAGTTTVTDALSTIENTANETDTNSSLPENTTTTNSSWNVTDSSRANTTLTEADSSLSTAELSNTSISVNSTEGQNFSTQATAKKSSETATTGISSDNGTSTNIISSKKTNSSLKNISTAAENSTVVDHYTSTQSANATAVSEANDTTTTQTTPRTSRKQREVHRPARKPTHFRQVGNSPHFEARKVFGGPDEKWRFSDGTLVDQFSRQQRDVETLSSSSFAASKTPSLLVSLLTAIFILNNQLA